MKKNRPAAEVVHNAYYVPIKGHVPNPLYRLPVNFPCPCQSGKRLKKCCRDLIPKYVPKDVVKNWEVFFLLTMHDPEEKRW